MSPRWGTSWWRCGASGRSWPVTKRPCKRRWRGARSRRGGCGGGCRRRWSSSGSCGSAGSAARRDRGSSRTPSGTTRPSWRRCGGGAGTGTEAAGAGVPRAGRAEAPQPPRPPQRAPHRRCRRVPSAGNRGAGPAPEPPARRGSDGGGTRLLIPVIPDPTDPWSNRNP
ncbi:arf-GAP with GTPase, ANK repeat and PH domain-containing protein 2-like [Vidua chalybeata]|uniref:arf-GAP with GTPase, ANK repeat and PH domain-containing protein 2-like n=1 Tax=Vidua chalybeata TaxID=81927 RepID=UPI0023A7F425|nr:arf-GAP with GTPase, ANK repeat and PH domain-containing protein 2-like [Vidua chalybeata]